MNEPHKKGVSIGLLILDMQSRCSLASPRDKTAKMVSFAATRQAFVCLFAWLFLSCFPTPAAHSQTADQGAVAPAVDNVSAKVSTAGKTLDIRDIEAATDTASSCVDLVETVVADLVANPDPERKMAMITEIDRLMEAMDTLLDTGLTLARTGTDPDVVTRAENVNSALRALLARSQKALDALSGTDPEEAYTGEETAARWRDRLRQRGFEFDMDRASPVF